MIAMSSRRITVISIPLGFALLAAGCGGGSADRLPLHGTVSVASGEEISGSITFLPAKGQSGPSATAKLDKGRYQFDRGNGPTAGPHTVRVTKFLPRSIPQKTLLENQAGAAKASRTRPAGKEVSPQPKTEWTQEVDISNDGRYLCDIPFRD